MYQAFCPILLIAREKAPVSSEGERKKEIHISIYMFSHLIIYFLLAVSLGQIFSL
jgi:hypothetical protein